MTSSPSTLPQPSHEGDEDQSVGHKTSRPPGPKETLRKVSDAEQEVVAQYVHHGTASDDTRPGRNQPQAMLEQPSGLFCDDTGAKRGADKGGGEHFEDTLNIL